MNEQMTAATSENVWSCKIGGTIGELPKGADAPLRQAVQDAYLRLTGKECVFCFTGWDAQLTNTEREVAKCHE